MTWEVILKQLLAQGILGLFCGISMWVAWSKDREQKSDRKEYQEKLEEMAKAHKAEMNALLERYVSKSETWMSKYHEMAKAQDDTMSAMAQVVEHIAPGLAAAKGKGG